MPDKELRIGLQWSKSDLLKLLRQQLIPKPRCIFEAEAASQQPKDLQHGVEVLEAGVEEMDSEIEDAPSFETEEEPKEEEPKKEEPKEEHAWTLEAPRKGLRRLPR